MNVDRLIEELEKARDTACAIADGKSYYNGLIDGLSTAIAIVRRHAEENANG